MTVLLRLALVVAALLASPPIAASAVTASVSAGDRIDSGGSICTLAYTYRSLADGRTYAITAAHCRQPGFSSVTTDSGAVGTFIRSYQDHAGKGGRDIALLDFGPTVTPGRYVGGHRLVYGLDRPNPGDTVCRNGATTGEHCGVVQARRGAMQYLTAPDMVACAGGDSGGAVWIRRGGGAQIIGVWLGGVTMPDGTDLGRFAGLADSFTALGLT